MTFDITRIPTLRLLARTSGTMWYVAYVAFAALIFGPNAGDVGLVLAVTLGAAFWVGSVIAKLIMHDDDWSLFLVMPFFGMAVFFIVCLFLHGSQFGARAVDIIQRILNIAGTVTILVTIHRAFGYEISEAVGAGKIRFLYLSKIRAIIGLDMALIKSSMEQLEYLSDPEIPTLLREPNLVFKAERHGRWVYVKGLTIKSGNGLAYKVLSGYECEILGQHLSARERMTYIGI